MKTCPQCGSQYTNDLLEVCTRDTTELVAIVPAEGDDLLGQIIAGRFLLTQKLGEGGWGIVYRAIHTKLDRVCAIKLLIGLNGNSASGVGRFKREAKLASRIKSSHAAFIYDFGEADNKTLYLAMEYVDGKTLTHLLEEEGPLPASRIVHIARQIADALSAAHALGMIHRDLKPDNIMITRNGMDTDYVKVLDFGIAKPVADDTTEKLTGSGYILGTPEYMSPEQVLGGMLDTRSDLYSLALIVYEMFTGCLPFNGDSRQARMISRVISEPIPLRQFLPALDIGIERAVMNGLARDQQSRTKTVGDFIAELSGGAAFASKAGIAVGDENIRNTDQGATRIAAPPTEDVSGEELSNPVQRDVGTLVSGAGQGAHELETLAVDQVRGPTALPWPSSGVSPQGFVANIALEQAQPATSSSFRAASRWKKRNWRHYAVVGVLLTLISLAALFQMPGPAMNNPAGGSSPEGAIVGQPVADTNEQVRPPANDAPPKQQASEKPRQADKSSSVDSRSVDPKSKFDRNETNTNTKAERAPLANSSALRPLRAPNAVNSNSVQTDAKIKDQNRQANKNVGGFLRTFKKIFGKDEPNGNQKP